MNPPRSLELEDLPGSLGKLVTGELRDGEQIAWLGRPGKGPLALIACLVLLLAGGSMFLFGWLIATLIGSPGFLWALTCVVFFIVFLGFFSILWGRKQERQTAYVITNKRALIVEQKIFPIPPVARNHAKTTSFSPAELAKLQYRHDSSDVGTLIFETQKERDSEGNVYIVEIGFLRIPDARYVHELLLRLARGQGWSPPVEETRPAPVLLSNVKPVPDITDPPRNVSWSVQRRLFKERTSIPMMIVGGMFAGFSLVFILPALFSNDWPQKPSEIAAALVPCLLFFVGVGLFLTPIVLWRRRVTVFRDGLLVRVRLIAYQDANLADSWTSYDPVGFNEKRWFTGIAAAPLGSMHPSDGQGETPIDRVLRGFGCILKLFIVVGTLAGLLLLASIWFNGNQAIENKLLASAGIIAFFGAFVGIGVFMKRDLIRSSTLRPTANVRFAFANSSDEPIDATGTIDVLEWRVRNERTEGPLAFYLPGNPRRVFLLLGRHPTIEISEGVLT